MTRLAAAVRWLHDPEVSDHPRYRAWERRHVLLAVRAAAITLTVVLAADSALLFDEAPGLWVINGAGAIGSIAVLVAVRRGGNARRSPVAGAWTLGFIAISTTMLPIAVMPSVAALMVAYMPIVIIASALFVPWSIRWHLPWLLATVGSVAAFAASPLAATLTEAARQELVSITISAALVSFAGHAILQRERRRTFVQRIQLRGLNQTARRQRRELEALAAQLEAVARRDSLTGIGNRLRLDEDVAMLRRTADSPDRPAAAILLDIDHFKEYNDRHGHLAGDEVLREVARTVAINVRPQDRVYRFGGEEFLVLLEGSDPEAAAEAAERLRVAVEALQIPNAANTPWNILTVSAGVAALRLADVGSDEWIREADERLYVSKGAGRNRVTGPSPAVVALTGPRRRPRGQPGRAAASAASTAR